VLLAYLPEPGGGRWQIVEASALTSVELLEATFSKRDVPPDLDPDNQSPKPPHSQ
jgi:hypothetical protein